MTGKLVCVCGIAGMILVLASLAMGPSTALAAGAGDAKYVVIVNAENNWTGSPTKALALTKKLFLKKGTKWDNNLKAKPLDRGKDDPAHKAFLERVLKMTESKLAAHWKAVKQKSGRTAPWVVKSTKTAAKMVAKNKGGFCFVEAKDADPPPKGTRVLFEF